MINYKCEACGEELEAPPSLSGKPAECHKCHNIQNVPLPEFLPRVSCPNCEHELDDLSDDQAGLIVKCPKCGCAVRVPEKGGGSGCGLSVLVGLLLGVGLTALTFGAMR